MPPGRRSGEARHSGEVGTGARQGLTFERILRTALRGIQTGGSLPAQQSRWRWKDTKKSWP